RVLGRLRLDEDLVLDAVLHVGARVRAQPLDGLRARAAAAARRARRRLAVLPLAALDRDAARRVAGIFTDIDDTLTTDGALDPAGYRALCAAAEAGLRVVPVTGRPGGWAEVLAALWPVAAVVAENGGLY